MKTVALGAVLAAALLGSTAAGAVQTHVTIKLNNIGGVNAGTPQYQVFQTAAKFWSDHLTTSQPVTLNINVGFGHLGPNILGSTRSTFTSKTVQGVEGRIIARQYGSFDAQAASHLPGLSTGQYGVGALDVYTPGYTGCCSDTGEPYGIDNATKVYDTDGSYNNSVIGLTTANAKALGYTFAPGTVDASITFSSDFAFDFNPQDGIDAGSSDFLAVAIHEMGHALGFVSGVDDYDVLGTGGPLVGVDCGGFQCQDYAANDDWFGETLDLFRYSGAGALDWTTNTASYLSVDNGATAYRGGLFSTGTYTGDGWQASHWKAPTVVVDGTTYFSCAQPKLGILNPYICDGRNGIVTDLDFAALDAIGWNTTVDVGRNPGLAFNTNSIAQAVPEPAVWGLMIAGFGFVGAAARRRRSGYATA